MNILRHATSVGLLWTNDQPDEETLPDDTQHLQETDIHASEGIRTRNTSKRATVDPRPRHRAANAIGSRRDLVNEKS
jgi:hypothetical protein